MNVNSDSSSNSEVKKYLKDAGFMDNLSDKEMLDIFEVLRISILTASEQEQQCHSTKPNLLKCEEFIDTFNSVQSDHEPLPRLHYLPKYKEPFYFNPELVNMSSRQRSEAIFKYHEKMLAASNDFGSCLLPNVAFLDEFSKSDIRCIDNLENKEILDLADTKEKSCEEKNELSYPRSLSLETSININNVKETYTNLYAENFLQTCVKEHFNTRKSKKTVNNISSASNENKNQVKLNECNFNIPTQILCKICDKILLESAEYELHVQECGKNLV